MAVQSLNEILQIIRDKSGVDLDARAEWLDMTIEPNTMKPTTSYKVLTVFRSKDKNKVDDFIQSWISNLSRIFDAIEA